MAFGLEKLTSMFGVDLKKARTNQIIGVDIGTSSIKIIQLHSEEGTPTLDTYGELQLGPYGNSEIAQMVDLPQQTVTEALVDIIRESSVSAGVASLSVPYSSSFAAAITVGATEDANIASRVPVEARKYVPVSLGEVTMDWFVLSKDPQSHNTDLFLVAIHNEALIKFRGILSGAGLKTAYTELEPFSTVRSTLSVKEPTAAMLDFGASAAKLYIVRDGVVQATHSLAHGGVELTDRIAKEKNITFTQAEELKRAVGVTDSDESIAAILRNPLERLTREADRIIDAYEQKSGIAIASVVLLGGGAAMPGLLPYVSDIVQRRVVVADPFSKVAYPAFLSDTLKDAGPSFAVALGGALRQFELS